MVANFGAESTTPQELPVNSSPKAGVSKPPAFLQGISDIFEDAGEVLKKRKESRNQKSVSDFTQRQLLVADALSQGRIRSSAHAQTLMRKNLLDAIDANPALTKDLISAQASILGLSGGAKVVADGTKEEQRWESRKNALATAGLVSASASEQEFANADEMARVAVAASERHRLRMQTLDAELKDINLTSARRSELEAQRKAETERFVSDNSTAEFTIVRNKFEEILGSDASEADKISAIKQYYTEWQAKTAAQLGSVNSGMRDALKGSFDRLEEHYLALASGEIGDAETKRRTQRTLSSMKALALADPTIARLATINELFGEQGLVQVLSSSGNKSATDAFLKFLAAGPDSTVEMDTLYTEDKDVKTGQRGGLDSVTKNLISNDETKKQAATEKMQQILNSLEDDAGRISRDPKKAIAIIDWLASPSFLKAVKNNPDAFDNIDGVSDLLDQHYHDEVSGLIRREFSENRVKVVDKVGGAGVGLGVQLKEVGSDSLVQAVSNDSGMTFQAIDPKNREARAEADRLNKTLKPIINNSLKAQAHLAGRSDYGAIWEESAKAILGSGDDNQLAGGDAGDDLVLDDLVSNLGSVKKLADAEVDSTFVGNIEGAGFEHGRKMSAVEGMIIHHTGGRGKASDIVGVLQERGLSVQYVIDREGKVHQLMNDDDEAWHAGKNNKSGFSNKNTLGVEIIANDNADVTPVQIESARRLIKSKASKFGFNPQEHVFGHGEVATHKRKAEGQAVISSIRGN